MKTMKTSRKLVVQKDRSALKVKCTTVRMQVFWSKSSIPDFYNENSKYWKCSKFLEITTTWKICWGNGIFSKLLLTQQMWSSHSQDQRDMPLSQMRSLPHPCNYPLLYHKKVKWISVTHRQSSAYKWPDCTLQMSEHATSFRRKAVRRRRTFPSSLPV